MQWAAICACEQVPKCFLLFHGDETGDIPDLSCKHPSRRQEEQKIINKATSIVSLCCWSLCRPSSRVFHWPLANLSQHCVAAARHPCFSAFLCLHRLRGGSPRRPPSQPHTTNSGVFLLLLWSTFRSQDVSCTHSRDFSDVCCRSAALLFVSKGGICVYFPILWCWTSRAEGPQTQVARKKKKTKLDSAQKQRAEQTQGRDMEWKLFQAGAPSAFTLES